MCWNHNSQCKKCIKEEPGSRLGMPDSWNNGPKIFLWNPGMNFKQLLSSLNLHLINETVGSKTLGNLPISLSYSGFLTLSTFEI